MAYTHYWNDYNDWMVYGTRPQTLMRLDYLPGKKYLYGTYTDYEVHDVHRCPTAPVYCNDRHWDASCASGTWWLGSTYGSNERLHYASKNPASQDPVCDIWAEPVGGSWSYSPPLYARISQIPHPYNVVFTGEKPMEWGGSGSYYLQIQGSPNRINPRWAHLDGTSTNISFIDGHTEAMSVKEVYNLDYDKQVRGLK